MFILLLFDIDVAAGNDACCLRRQDFMPEPDSSSLNQVGL
jgi:hypothetical protein